MHHAEEPFNSVSVLGRSGNWKWVGIAGSKDGFARVSIMRGAREGAEVGGSAQQNRESGSQ